MKKMFTSLCSKRALLSAALIVTSALSALAGGEDWYAYHVQVSAYPTGAGVVYVDTTTMAEDVNLYAETVTREFTTKSTLLYGYAKANDGWQLLGFAKDTIDAVTGNVALIDSVSIVSDGWSDYFSLSPLEGATSKHLDESGMEVSDDSLTVSGLMPLDPNNYFRAIFTHLAVQVNSLQTTMGFVKIDKLVNNIGDKVTIEAIPANEYCSFENWTLDGEVVSSEAKLTVEVKGVANYVANFKDERSVTLHFPAEGGYLVWYNKYDYMLNDLLSSYSPTIYYAYDNSQELVDSVSTSGLRTSFLNGVTSSYISLGYTPAILYGFGDVTISPSTAEEAIIDESYDCALFRWSGEEGVKVEELPAGDPANELTFAYYTFDIEKMQFNHITAGQIAPNSLYMRIFTNMFGAGLEIPEVIYFDQATFEKATSTGISSVKSQVKGEKAIYDLQGRRVSAPAKGGIYVTDGRKIVYRQK